jgi:hypothetical protein
MGNKKLISKKNWILYIDWGWPLWLLPHLDVEKGKATWGITFGWAMVCITAQWVRPSMRVEGLNMGALLENQLEG